VREIAGALAAEHPHLNAAEHRGRGGTPALPARTRRLPAIAIGSLDRHGLPPKSHQPTDTPDAIDPAATQQTVELGLLLVNAIDTALEPGRTRNTTDQQGAATPA
jgi:hypothetical protein